jgi:hypothetical protein
MDGLPVESLTLTAMRDSLTPEQRDAITDRDDRSHGPWSQTAMLLALIADRIAQQTWVLGEWKHRPPAPQPIPRPGVDGATAGRPRTLQDVLARADPRARDIAERLRRGESIE